MVVCTPNGDHLIPSDILREEVALEWIKKIDTAMSAATATIETDWATVLKKQVVAAYLEEDG